MLSLHSVRSVLEEEDREHDVKEVSYKRTNYNMKGKVEVMMDGWMMDGQGRLGKSMRAKLVTTDLYVVETDKRMKPLMNVAEAMKRAM
ncbi:hypothetical protein EVAR_98030_1 [Eumeta japonica]|uniref:Uncharacterized protein n=1 Tax=Eumeta variegata TaxID=151549 RepID=A0A4C1ZXN5_EUMVA|nr:hypothetical protein EVAR_98030_1 [Eumeta japonica]